MPQEYDQTTLKKIQNYELGILKDFIHVCEENNIAYFCDDGTALGALRHKGFIPWDDDIDIAVLREDYDKLISVFQSDYTDKYTVVSADLYDDYPMPNTHICINDSRFTIYDERKLKCPLGIFLDIFPLDHCSQDPKAYAKHKRKAWIFSKLLILKHIPFPVVPFNGLAKKLAHCATATVWFFLNLFHISHRYLRKKILFYASQNNDDPTAPYSFFGGQSVNSYTYSHEDIFPLKKVPFENLEVNIANDADKILTHTFGDYMQLPPVEKRHNHFPYALKFPGEEPIYGNEK